MPGLSILFADDHIPNSSFSADQNEIEAILRQRYPRWTDEIIDGWVKAYYYSLLRIKRLRDEGYNVTPAKTYNCAMELVGKSRFDVAIIDLNWHNDEAFPGSRDERESAGWNICGKIEEKNNKNPHTKPTLQIIISSKFTETPSLSSSAAKRGILPFFKADNLANPEALVASVEFLKKYLGGSSRQEDFSIKIAEEIHKTTLESLSSPFTQQKQWTILTLACVAFSILLILIGSAGAIFWNIQLDRLTSIASILSGLISSLLFVQLQRSQKFLTANQQTLNKIYRDSIERALKTGPPKP